MTILPPQALHIPGFMPMRSITISCHVLSVCTGIGDYVFWLEVTNV
jgi:hypothetical protein